MKLTKGDIFECILGLCYLSENNDMPPHMDKWSQHISVVGALLDHAIYNFWSLLQRMHYTENRWLDFLDAVQELCDVIYAERTSMHEVIPSEIEAIALEQSRPRGAPKYHGSLSSANAVTTAGVLYSTLHKHSPFELVH